MPPGTRVTAPEAGILLWVELPPRITALEVHRRALALGIGHSTRPLFTLGAELQNVLRLNSAKQPTAQLLNAVGQIGAICHELMD